MKKVFIESSCFGLSGCDTEKDYEIYKKIIFKIKDYLNSNKIIICNDAKIGLHAATNNKNSLILICGTGSICYGFNENGIEVRANGWDFILGDEGSGYEIGVKALRAIMRNYDSRGENTLLLKTILEDLKLNNIFELINWTYNKFSKEKIANIAKTVERTAHLGDKKSIEIITEQAFEAIKSVKAVVEKLNIQNIYFECILAGSIFKDEKYFKSVVISNLKKLYKKINVKHLQKKPVEGAIKLALKNINL